MILGAMPAPATGAGHPSPLVAGARPRPDRTQLAGRFCTVLARRPDLAGMPQAGVVLAEGVVSS